MSAPVAASPVLKKGIVKQVSAFVINDLFSFYNYVENFEFMSENQKKMR